MNQFMDISLDELTLINGGASWGSFWASVSVASGALGMAVGIGKTVATAATVTAVAGLTAGLGIAVLGGVAAIATAKAISSLRK